MGRQFFDRRINKMSNRPRAWNDYPNGVPLTGAASLPAEEVGIVHCGMNNFDGSVCLNVTEPFIDRSSRMWKRPQKVCFSPLGALEKGKVMKKALMALAAVASLAVAAVAAPAPAQAQRGVAAGVAAGLIGGAIVGGAIASQNPYYYGPGDYGPRSYYGGPAYVAGPVYSDCYWQRQRFWDGYGWRFRRMRVCG